MVERGTENPCVGSSILSLGTMYLLTTRVMAKSCNPFFVFSEKRHPRYCCSLSMAGSERGVAAVDYLSSLLGVRGNDPKTSLSSALDAYMDEGRFEVVLWMAAPTGKSGRCSWMSLAGSWPNPAVLCVSYSCESSVRCHEK